MFSVILVYLCEPHTIFLALIFFTACLTWVGTARKLAKSWGGALYKTGHTAYLSEGSIMFHNPGLLGGGGCPREMDKTMVAIWWSGIWFSGGSQWGSAFLWVDSRGSIPLWLDSGGVHNFLATVLAERTSWNSFNILPHTSQSQTSFFRVPHNN